MRSFYKLPIVIRLSVYIIIIGFLGFLLSVIIGLIVAPGENDEMPDWCITAGYVAACVFTVVGSYFLETNGLKRLYEQVQATRSDVKSISIRAENVIFQLEVLIRQHMEHEAKVYSGISKDAAEAQKGMKSVKYFRSQILNYPSLGSDKAVMDLFQEITNCQDQIMNAKLAYNAYAVDYNSGIRKFPINILSRMKPVEYFQNPENDDLSEW